jgi:hypothetical protein
MSSATAAQKRLLLTKELQTLGACDMSATIKNRASGTSWQKRYDAKAPRAGDLAPDFELSDVDGANPVRLSSFKGEKPVALIFGSFT